MIRQYLKKQLFGMTRPQNVSVNLCHDFFPAHLNVCITRINDMITKKHINVFKSKITYHFLNILLLFLFFPYV